MPHAPVSDATTYTFLGLLIAMILALALEEKLHAKKSLITGVFAAVSLGLGAFFDILPAPAVVHGHELPVYIPAIEWEVIIIILGSTLFIDVISRSGIFTWIAIKMTKYSGGSPRRLLAYYGILTVVFSALLNNVTAMIIIGSLSIVSLEKLERKDLALPFLLTLGLLTNIGGLLTLISSVPNIILGTAAGFSFLKFFIVAAPYVVVTTAATLWLANRIYRIDGHKNEEEKERARRRVADFDESESIESVGFFRLAWVLLGGFIFCIALTSSLPYLNELGMGAVAFAFAFAAMLRYRNQVDRSYAAVDWDLIFFFCFLFVVIHMMGHAQVLALIGDGMAAIIGLGDTAGAASLLVTGAVASSVTDNVPLAAVAGTILSAKESVSPSIWWSTIFGTNLGGNLTPIGSASTVVAVSIIHKHKLKLSFGGFVIKALPLAILHIAIALAYVLLFLR